MKQNPAIGMMRYSDLAFVLVNRWGLSVGILVGCCLATKCLHLNDKVEWVEIIIGCVSGLLGVTSNKLMLPVWGL